MAQPNAIFSWLLRGARQGQVWCALLALSIGLSVVDLTIFGATVPAADSSLSDDRTVVAYEHGNGFAGESSSRSVLTAVGFTATAVVVFLLSSLFNGWVGRRLDTEAASRERSGILVLGQLSLALVLIRMFDPAVMPTSIRTGLHLLSLLMMVTLALKGWIVERRGRAGIWMVAWLLLADDRWVVAILLIAGGVLGTVAWSLDLAGRSPTGSSLVVWALYLLVLLVLVALYSIFAWRVWGHGGPGSALRLYDLNSAAIAAGIPVLLAPLSVLVANEIHIARPGLPSTPLTLMSLAALTLASVVLFWLYRSGRIRWRAASLVTVLYLPIALATLVSFKTYRRTLDLGRLDYFTAGQLSLPAQQWFEFGRLPLLDLIPAHGLSDVGIQSLFTLLNGPHGLDMLVWLPWLPVVVGFLAIFAFLTRVVSPLPAFAITALLPVGAAVPGANAVALIPAAVLVAVVRRPTLGRLLALWLVVGLVWLWRPELGPASFVAALVVLGFVTMLDRRGGWTRAVAALAIALAAIPVGLLVADVVGTGDGGRALGFLFAAATDAAASGAGAIEIAGSLQNLALFLERLLPIIAAISILAVVMHRAVRRQGLVGPALAVLYLAIFSLVAPATVALGSGTVRLNPSTGLLLAAVAPMMVLPRPAGARRLGRTTWLMVTVVICSFLAMPRDFPLVGLPRRAGAPERPAGAHRVDFVRQPHQELVSLLDRTLEEDQTFFDFTGSPALYPLTGRRFPLSEIVRFDTSSEALQRSQLAELEAELEGGSLPLVVFSAPRAVAANEGALPAAVVAYRISEFVYRNYLPWVEVDGWQVWRQRGLKIAAPAGSAYTMSPTRVHQHFDLGRLPAVWAAADPWRSAESNEIVATLLDEPTAVRPKLPLTLAWDDVIDPSGGSYLHLRVRPIDGSDLRESATLKVTYGQPRPSNVELVVSNPDGEAPAEEDSWSQPLRDDPKMHNAHRVRQHPDRLVFRTGGRDPWVRRLADFSDAPVIAAGEELWLRLRYRSTKAGQAQVFFAVAERRFSETKSVEAEVTSTVDGGEAELLLPVVGGEPGDRLVDLRLDPPPDSEFEVVAIELVQSSRRFEDHMIRMSAQWRWFHGGFEKLTLRADAPILIESVVVRAGD